MSLTICCRSAYWPHTCGSRDHKKGHSTHQRACLYGTSKCQLANMSKKALAYWL